MITQTTTNNPSFISSTNSNSGSSSSSSSSSTDTNTNNKTPVIKTGTFKEYKEYKPTNTDYFDKIKLAREQARAEQQESKS